MNKSFLGREWVNAENDKMARNFKKGKSAMKQLDYNQLSKEISYALRHAPWEYELELDAEGWVPLMQLVASLKESKQWNHITKEDILDMIAHSVKKRHEVKEEKIRAYYGHSVPIRIKKSETMPPIFLYHGTTRLAQKNILESGLLPWARQYVHLSEDIETAKIVGQRRDENPVVLVIAAREAYNDGNKFYHGNEKVWLADSISRKYIRVT